MRVGIIQNTPVFGERDRNLDAVERQLDQHLAELWVLPELFASGYLFLDRGELDAAAEPLGGGPVQDRLRRWAEERDAAFCAGFAERDGEKIYNAASLIGPQGRLAHYRKLHLFNTEKLVFDPGESAPPVAEWRGVQCGIMICFDWRFPETARSLALDGAELILHPSNLVLRVCPPAMITRALENGVFTVTANRGGRDDRGEQSLVFHCGSQVVAPDGEVLGSIEPGGEGVLIVEIDAARARDKAVTALNDLIADRRPEHYHR
jgi:predicted amidohydrolase